MKNSELKAALDNIDIAKDIKLGGTITLALVRNKKKLEAAYKTFNETREELCKQHAEKDESGKIKTTPIGTNGFEYVFTSEGLDLFNKEFQEIYNADSDVTLDKFNEAILEKYADLTVTQMESLMFFAE